MESKNGQRIPPRTQLDYWAYLVDLTTKMYAQLEEPPSEIIIERFQQRWCMVVGSRHIPIKRPTGYWFYSSEDPMEVTLALKAQANGPINVIWNL